MPADSIGEWVRILAAAVGILGGLWAIVFKTWRAWQKRVRMRRLESKAIRYLLDAQRHTLHFVTPTAESKLVRVEELLRQKLLIDEVRDDLWTADGHASEHEDERRVEEIVRVLTRTQAIRMKFERERQDVDR